MTAPDARGARGIERVEIGRSVGYACPTCRPPGRRRGILDRVSSVRGFLRTSSQFVYVVAILVAAPSLALLAWAFLDTSRFLSGSVLGLALGQVAAAAAGGTAIANAVSFLRPDDMAPWMLPVAGVLLLVFAGLMVLLFVLPR